MAVVEGEQFTDQAGDTLAPFPNWSKEDLAYLNDGLLEMQAKIQHPAFSRALNWVLQGDNAELYRHVDHILNDGQFVIHSLEVAEAINEQNTGKYRVVGWGTNELKPIPITTTGWGNRINP